MDWTIVGLMALLGCFTGFAAGLLGIGGGLIITPFLTMLLPESVVPREYLVHVAIATSLATIAFTSLSSVRAHHKRGAVLWSVVWRVAPGILFGAWIGAKIAGMLSTFWISLVFAVFVGFSSFRMFSNKPPVPSHHLPGSSGMFGAGSVIGFLSSLVGAGGGFISVPWMVWSNVKIHNAVATSAALGFPIAFAGTISYVYNGWDAGVGEWPVMVGYICLPALASIAVTSILFAPLGAKVAHSIDTKPLKKIFACLLCVLCLYMLRQALISL